jgi:hypothetical protein
MSTKRPPTVDDLYDRRHANRARRNIIALSPETAAKCEAGLNAWGVLRKTFTQWLVIGEAVIAMRSRAEEIGGRATFKRIMHQQGFGDLVDAKGKAILSKLEKIMKPENLLRVMEWHQKLSAKEQIAWSSPSSVVRWCPVFKPATSGPRLPGQRRDMPAEQRVEYAIDVITGYCMKTPTERDAILRRILGPLDLELAALAAARDSEPPAEDWRQEQAADYDKVAAALRFLVPKVLDEQVNYDLDEMVADLMARSDLGFTNSSEVAPLADLIAMLIEKLPTLDEEMQAEPAKAKPAPKRKGRKRTKAKPRAEASPT